MREAGATEQTIARSLVFLNRHGLVRQRRIIEEHTRSSSRCRRRRCAAEYGGRTIVSGQGNNVFVFPGLGLGVNLSKAHQITDSMFLMAARTLVSCVTREEFESRSLYPSQSRVREVSRRIACAVMREARRLNLGKQLSDEEIEAAVDAGKWDPQYE